MARFALALVCAFVALGITSARATADSSSNVLVSATVYTSSGNTSDSVTLAALQADPGRCPIYGGPETMHELGRQGFVDVPLPPGGAQTGTWALSTALACMQAPIALNAVRGITVLNLDGAPQTGSWSQLGPSDLAPPSDFSDASEVPVVEALGSSNQYDRPWRGNADQDFLDEVQQSQNDGQPAPISIEVFEGPMLTVKVTASRTSVPVGGVVTFRATVTGPNLNGLSYSWSFGGGAPGSSASAPRIGFENAGQYDVTVQVTDAAGGGGVGSIPITVGGKAPAAIGGHSRRGGGSAPTSRFPTGPRNTSGSHPGGPAGSSKHGGSTHSGTSSGGATPSHTQRTTASTATTPAATTPGGAATAARNPAPSSHSTSPVATRPRPASRSRVPPKPASAYPSKGPVVAGRLISDVVPLAPGASPLVHVVPSTVESAPPARRALRASALPAIGAALAVALLFGLGVRRELGWRLDRRLHWRALRPGQLRS